MSEVKVSQLKNNLSKTYSIKCFVDLADLTTTSTRAYKILQQHHQVEFLSHDRLVFYTEHAIPDQLLRHIYQAATLIDVSNFFLLFCSPFDIGDQVRVLAQENLGDNVPFHWIQKNIKNTKPLMNNFALPNTLCPMPWTHMLISPSGRVSPCCVYQGAVGSVIDDTMHNIFHNQDYVQLRQQLLAGEKVAGCKNCWDLEDRLLTSPRTRHLSLLKTDLVTKYLDAPTITSLDISPGNTCNFKCRICGPGASSLFAQETQSTSDIIPVKSLNWTDSTPKVLEEILGLLPSLTNIDMYGGEPFLIRHLHRLVQEAVDQDQAKHIRLHYNSNGSIYPNRLIELWKKFKHIDIQFSIDNVRERFELERGGSWAEVEANICRLVDLKLPNLKISIMPTVNVMNILYLDEVLQWADSLSLPVNFNYLSTPAEFSIKNLTAQAKKIIIEKLKNHPRSEVINMLATIQSLPDSDGKDFVNLSKHFDRIRNQNLLTTHRDIATAMGMM